MITLCIDVGTSLIKTVAFDDRGTEIALARQETVVMRPAPGFSEQDMCSVWDAVTSTTRAVVRQLTGPVRLISLTAQGDGCWLIDSDGRPTGPAFGRFAFQGFSARPLNPSTRVSARSSYLAFLAGLRCGLAGQYPT